ncbi:MAG: hypothetical protein K0R92_380 [Lachnospiraceae bacterium]|jgi:hypothetical protein|nr:hypothetical protein [Lachnospiraceae bacterium]
MDRLEYEKAKKLRQIAEARETTEPVADFTVKKFADGHITTAASGSLIEIAALLSAGLHDIEATNPGARNVFEIALKFYLKEG